MPRGDRSGPAGMGPMTGRGAGYCAGFNTPGFANRMGGGFGFGRGFGRGMGRGYGMGQYQAAPPTAGWTGYNVPPMDAEGEMSALKQQAAVLKQQMDAIQNRLDDLSGNDSEEKVS